LAILGTSRTTHIVVRLIALAIALAAAILLWGLERSVLNQESIGPRLFALPCTAISVWLIYVAYHGWFHRTATSIRRLCSTLTFIIFFIATGFWDSHVQGAPPFLRHYSMVWFAAGLAIAILFYLLISGKLIRKLNITEDRSASEQRRHVDRLVGYLGLAIIFSAAAVAQDRILQNPLPDTWTAYLLLAVVLAAGLVNLLGPRIFWRLTSSDPFPSANR